MAAETRAGEATAESEADTRERMAFDEAMARYDGQWVLLRVLAEDARHTPTTVEVVAAAASEQQACAALDPLRTSGEPPQFPYYLALAGPRIRTGADLRRALREAATDRDERGVSGWRRW